MVKTLTQLETPKIAYDLAYVTCSYVDDSDWNPRVWIDSAESIRAIAYAIIAEPQIANTNDWYSRQDSSEVMTMDDLVSILTDAYNRNEVAVFHIGAEYPWRLCVRCRVSATDDMRYPYWGAYSVTAVADVDNVVA